MGASGGERHGENYAAEIGSAEAVRTEKLSIEWSEICEYGVHAVELQVRK